MHKNLKKTYFLGFLISIAIALVSYINSSFLEQFINKKYEGLLFACASIITIIFMLLMPKALNIFGNRKTILFLSSGIFFALFGLANTQNTQIAILSFLTFFSFQNLVIMNLDIFIEDFSKNKNIGKWRGLYLTISNMGWVLSQIISGQIIEKYSFRGIYTLSSIFVLFFFFILLFSLKDFKDPQYQKMNLLKSVKRFSQKINLKNIYFINFILKFFYAWMVIYTPIYLHENLNVSWETIGFIFAIMLTPFVFLSFPMGRLSDKIGEKEMLILGFSIIIVSTFFIPFLTGSKIYLLILVLFATRVGASIIETMSESYFFKNIKEEDTDELSFFRTNTPLAYVIAPIIATAILFIIPEFKYIFWVLALILLSGLFTSLKLKDTN